MSQVQTRINEIPTPKPWSVTKTYTVLHAVQKELKGKNLA
jgi:hypothetical protein